MLKEIFSLFYKPEYIVLLISILAICVNIYIAWKNRKYALAKEEYFKLQQVFERINAKLLFLENHRAKLKIFFEQSFKVSQNPKLIFIDMNDTFNKTVFEKDGEKITALIDIYFDNIGKDWNYCLDKMSSLFTLVFALSKNIENGVVVDWKKEAENFNKISIELGGKPKEISDTIKSELKKFKEKNL